MSYLHDWHDAPKEIVEEYVDCMRTGDTKRAREIATRIHAKNKLAQKKNPGVIERLLGFVKGKEMPK